MTIYQLRQYLNELYQKFKQNLYLNIWAIMGFINLMVILLLMVISLLLFFTSVNIFNTFGFAIVLIMSLFIVFSSAVTLLAIFYCANIMIQIFVFVLVCILIMSFSKYMSSPLIEYGCYCILIVLFILLLAGNKFKNINISTDNIPEKMLKFIHVLGSMTNIISFIILLFALYNFVINA